MSSRICFVDSVARYLFLVLMAYAWSMMPIIFLLSFTFNEATSAYVWLTIVNILSGLCPPSLPVPLSHACVV